MRRLGMFTRLIGATPDEPAERVYRDALEQFVVAERLGYDVGWVAQHHVDAEEGGLPSPLVFLAQVAARTERLRLATGILTLALEDPVRVAEDAAVLDTLSGGRLELGLGSGGNADVLTAFGRDPTARAELYARAVDRLLDVLAGAPHAGTARRLHPPGTRLLDDVWQATFSPGGGARAGHAGSGLLLSRHQPRTAGAPGAPLADIQQPIVDAYLAALPPGTQPRIGASRALLAGRDGERVRELARAGVERFARHLRRAGQPVPDGDADALLAAFDVHVGTPEEVTASLAADPVVVAATDLIVQVHPTEPGQHATLESLELVATEVAPALGRAPLSTAGAHS